MIDGMTLVDWIIVAVLVLAVLAGFARGFFGSAFSLAGLVVGLSLAAWNSWRLAPVLKPLVRSIEAADAIAFIINGKRLKNSGSGGDADFGNRMRGTRYPSGTWVQSLIAGNGKRLEIPVAMRTNTGFVPLPGVQWVFPATQNNPQETLTEAK